MTFHDDPNINRRTNRRRAGAGWSTGSIILACLVVLAVIGGIVAMSTRTDDRAGTASNIERTSPPSAPPRASTTGSGPTR